MTKRPTIYSIARELGLHASTVSRAFSRPGMVRPEVRERILAKAEELHYVPNPVARGLITGQTGMIGLLIPDIENPFFAPFVRSVQRAAGAEGLKVLLMDSGRDPSAEPALVSQVRGQVDGLVLASPRHTTKDLVAAARSVPHVLVNRRSPGAASVVIDNTAALRDAGDYLVGLGHRRFALLRGPTRSWAAAQRTRAVQGWAVAAAVELVELGPFEALFEGGVDAARTIRESGATAVIAFDDLMACGAVAGLAQLGVGVPEEVSIVGCDDVLLARTITPALTTIRAPFQEVGDTAVATLRRLMADPEVREDVELAGELVLRASTAPPPPHKGSS